MMNQLVIKLTGKINSSNFDEWKKDLILQIQGTIIDLATDDDFAEAAEQVKSFKSAEKSLKQAKQSAIDQAEEIQHLFSAIDEISEEARQARLFLERQIKARKLEIKNEHIQAGMDVIQAFIDKQADEFKHTDESVFLNRGRFESAVSGKAGVKGLQNAIEHLCDLIKREVVVKAAELADNKARIDALPGGYKLLFQDWKTLIDLPKNELEPEIDKRIARYDEELARNKAEKQQNALERIDDSNRNPEQNTADSAESEKEKYRIIIDLLATKDKAKELARAIKDRFGNEQSIDNIKLTRNRDD